MKTMEEIQKRLKAFEIENSDEFGTMLYEEAAELEAKIEALNWVLGLLPDDDFSVGMNRYHETENRIKLNKAISKFNF